MDNQEFGNDHLVGSDNMVQEAFNGLLKEQGSPVGLVLQAELPFDDWKDRVRSLAQVRSFGPFAVGDVFLYGMQKFGEKRALAQEPLRLADYSLQFIRKCADVCAAIPYVHRRAQPLSFEHHAAVYKLRSPGCIEHPDRPDGSCGLCSEARLDLIGAWLDKALSHKWTAKELKDELKKETVTRVREHQRQLPGQDEEFDPERLKEALSTAKHYMMVVKDDMTGMLTKAGKLDRGKAKVLSKTIEELEQALTELKEQLA